MDKADLKCVILNARIIMAIKDGWPTQALPRQLSEAILHLDKELTELERQYKILCEEYEELKWRASLMK